MGGDPYIVGAVPHATPSVPRAATTRKDEEKLAARQLTVAQCMKVPRIVIDVGSNCRVRSRNAKNGSGFSHLLAGRA